MNEDIKNKAIDKLNSYWSDGAGIGVFSKAGDYLLFSRFDSWDCDHKDFIEKSIYAVTNGKQNSDLLKVIVKNWSPSELEYYRKILESSNGIINDVVMESLLNTMTLTGYPISGLCYFIYEIMKESGITCKALHDNIDEITNSSLKINDEECESAKDDVTIKSAEKKSEIKSLGDDNAKKISEESKKTAKRINALWRSVNNNNIMIAGVVVVGLSGFYLKLKYNNDLILNETLNPRTIDRLTEVITKVNENREISRYSNPLMFFSGIMSYKTFRMLMKLFNR